MFLKEVTLDQFPFKTLLIPIKKKKEGFHKTNQMGSKIIFEFQKFPLIFQKSC